MPPEDSEPKAPRPPLAQVFASPWFWVALLSVVIAAPLLRQARSGLAPAPLPVLGALPSFSLISQGDQPFGAEQLLGKVWVANFIFTRCPTICPPFTRKMAALQERTASLGPGVQLVSFSVDPGFDTPEVLQAYAQSHGADPGRWTFLTGDPELIRATVVDGLKVMLGRSGPADDLNSIFHGTHFVLVDRSLRIRGYYASDDADAVERLWEELRALAAEQTPD